MSNVSRSPGRHVHTQFEIGETQSHYHFSNVASYHIPKPCRGSFMLSNASSSIVCRILRAIMSGCGGIHSPGRSREENELHSMSTDMATLLPKKYPVMLRIRELHKHCSKGGKMMDWTFGGKLRRHALLLESIM